MAEFVFDLNAGLLDRCGGSNSSTSKSMLNVKVSSNL